MIKRGLYNIFSAVIRIGFSLLTVPVLIYLLGLEEFGLWTLATAVAGLLTLAEAGLSVSTTVFLSRDLATEDWLGLSQTLLITLGGMLIVATIAVIAMWVGAPFLVHMFTNLSSSQLDTAVKLFQLSGLLIWPRLIQMVLIGIEQSFNKYGVLNLLNTLQTVLTSLAIMGVAWHGGSTPQMMLWQIVMTICVSLIHVVFVFKLVRPILVRPLWSKTKFNSIVWYSGMNWLASLGGLFFTQLDRIVVGALLGPSLLGVYAAITSVTAQINTLSGLAIQPLLPMLSGVLAVVPISHNRIRKLLLQSFYINLAVVVMISSVFIAFAPLITRLLLAESQPSSAVLALRLCTVAYALYSLNAVGYYLLYALDSLPKLLIVNLLSGILSILLVIFGASNYGLIGAAIGNFGYSLSLLFIPLSLIELSRQFLSTSKFGAYADI